MALIVCPECGKSISDKAKVCPSCGHDFTNENNSTKKCPDCGTVVDVAADVCPNCGFPFNEIDTPQDNGPQKVEITSINIEKKSHKKLIIAIVAIVVAVAVAFGVVSSVKKKNAETAANSYQSYIDFAASKMLDGGISAESLCTLIHDVWYDAIYKNYSETNTKEYVKGCNGDFNTALSNLFKDSDFLAKQVELISNQASVESTMKQLINPVDGFEEAYTAIKELYDSYLTLTNLALDPTGSLSSYTSDYNSADSEFANSYDAMKLYLK